MAFRSEFTLYAAQCQHRNIPRDIFTAVFIPKQVQTCSNCSGYSESLTSRALGWVAGSRLMDVMAASLKV